MRGTRSGQGGVTSTLVALVLLLPTLGQAATRMTSETRIGKDAPQRSTLLADGQRFRLDPDANTSIVYHAGRGVLWLFDHPSHTYLEVNQAQYQSMGRLLAEQRAAQSARLAALPPEQRASAQRLLDEALGAPVAPPRVEIRETGRSERVAGIPCDVLEVTRNGEKVAEVCRASYAAAGVPRARFAALRAMASFLRDSASALVPESLQQGGIGTLGSFDALDGLPLRIRAYQAGVLRLETEVVSLEEQKVSDSAFEIPAGYQPKITIKVRKGVGGP